MALRAASMRARMSSAVTGQRIVEFDHRHHAGAVLAASPASDAGACDAAQARAQHHNVGRADASWASASAASPATASQWPGVSA